MRRVLALALSVAGGCAAGPLPALAGAWVQEPGHAFYKIAGRYVRADQLHDPGGRLVSIPTLQEFTQSLYGEYGLSRRLTVVAYLPVYERITLNEVVAQPGGAVLASGDSASGPADFDVGVRIGLRRDRPTVLSLGINLGLPVGEDDQKSGLLTGDGEFNQQVSLLAGHSFHPAPVYVSGEIGFNNRTRGFSDEFRYGAEIGWSPGSRLTLLLRVRGVESLRNGDDSVTGGQAGLYANNQEYLLYGPELICRLSRKFGFTASLEGASRVRNSLSATSYSVGLYWKL